MTMRPIRISGATMGNCNYKDGSFNKFKHGTFPNTVLFRQSPAPRWVLQGNVRWDCPSPDSGIRNQWLHFLLNVTITLSRRLRGYFTGVQIVNIRFRACLQPDALPQSAFHGVYHLFFEITHKAQRKGVVTITLVATSARTTTHNLVVII